MKKIRYIFILALLCLATSSAFAYISGKIALDEKRIYCPDQITCTKSGDISSCKYNNDNYQYWKGIQVPGGSPSTGTFRFIEVISGYHTGNLTMCRYKQNSQEISLHSKDESNLEAYYDKTTKWNPSSPPGYGYVCQSDNPNACPLKERSGFGVRNKDQKLFFAFSNNTDLLYGSGSSDYLFISYDTALICWSAKQCKIDIDMYSNDFDHTNIGSIVVDMDNKMKIIEILPVISSGMDIMKVAPFNTIEIKKSDTPPPTLPSLEIDNFIRGSVLMSVNNISLTRIDQNEHGNVYSDRAAEACQNTRECKIDLNTGLIGSVVVDIENNMKILSIETTRSSEIGINKINDHKIEVSYPNKK